MRLGGQDQHQSSQCASLPKALPQGDPGLKVLQLTEALRALLEVQGSREEQDFLRGQVSGDTAQLILEWLTRDEVGSDSHQSRHTNLTSGSAPHLLMSVDRAVLGLWRAENIKNEERQIFHRLGESRRTSSPSGRRAEKLFKTRNQTKKSFFFVDCNLTTAALQVEEVKVDDCWVNNGIARLPSPRLLLVLDVGL